MMLFEKYYPLIDSVENGRQCHLRAHTSNADTVELLKEKRSEVWCLVTALAHPRCNEYSEFVVFIIKEDEYGKQEKANIADINLPLKVVSQPGLSYDTELEYTYVPITVVLQG